MSDMYMNPPTKSTKPEKDKNNPFDESFELVNAVHDKVLAMHEQDNDARNRQIAQLEEDYQVLCQLGDKILRATEVVTQMISTLKAQQDQNEMFYAAIQRQEKVAEEVDEGIAETLRLAKKLAAEKNDVNETGAGAVGLTGDPSLPA